VADLDAARRAAPDMAEDPAVQGARIEAERALQERETLRPDLPVEKR